MIGRIRCLFGRHDPDDGTNRWDIPFNGWAIPDRFMDGGYVAKTQYRCRRCGRTTDWKFGHRQDAPAEYPLFPSIDGDTVDMPPTPEFEIEFGIDFGG